MLRLSCWRFSQIHGFLIVRGDYVSFSSFSFCSYSNRNIGVSGAYNTGESGANIGDLAQGPRSSRKKPERAGPGEPRNFVSVWSLLASKELVSELTPGPFCGGPARRGERQRSSSVRCGVRLLARCLDSRALSARMIMRCEYFYFC